MITLDALRLQEQRDDELIARHLAGEVKAFEELYHRYARFVAGVVYRTYGSQVDVDDVVQETFLEAYSSLESLQDPGALRSWLARIALRRVSSQLRTKKRRVGILSQLLPSIARWGDRRQEEDLISLRQVLDALPESQRTPWVLKHVIGMPLAEVAETCEISLSTVKRRIASADAFIDARWTR